jgi:hypothetical protein
MFVVHDLQTIDLDELAHVPGVFVEYIGRDDGSARAHRVSVYGVERAEVIEYVREQWGDEDERWFQEYVEDRVEETDQVPIPDIAAGADHSGNPTPGESFVLRMVEDAWYDVTKGEIDPEQDPPVRDVILALYRLSREQVDTTATAQVNRYGREYLDGEIVEMEEIAHRVARALSIVWFGEG